MIIFCRKNYTIQVLVSLRLLKQMLDSVKTSNKNYNNKIKNKSTNNTIINNFSDKSLRTLKLPYKDDHSTRLIKSRKTSTKKSLPENHDVRTILTDTKLSFQFNIKDDTNKQHKHDLCKFMIYLQHNHFILVGVLLHFAVIVT